MTFAKKSAKKLTDSPPSVSDLIRRQYERYPYPPIPRIGLPSQGEGDVLAFETGTRLAEGEARSHRGIRILVAGAGTFEALVVAQTHPLAAEVVAVDLSANALRMGRWRQRLGSWFMRLAPMRWVCADLTQWEPDQKFDYILASNMLHHVADPAALLRRLAAFLKGDGLLRVVTYPYASRLWMRATGRWLRLQGVLPGGRHLRSRAREAILDLPVAHPIRVNFENHPEIQSDAGVVDAFLNAYENPLSPLAWGDACGQAGLVLAAEGQNEDSQSKVLDEVLPECAGLSVWQKLEVLDRCLELCSNPIFWLRKGSRPSTDLVRKGALRISGDGAPALRELGDAWPLSSPFFWEMRANLEQIMTVLAPLGVSPERLWKVLREKFGSRVSLKDKSLILSGLAASDWGLQDIQNASSPLGQVGWECLEQHAPGAQLEVQEGSAWRVVPGKTLVEQGACVELRFGVSATSVRMRRS